MEQKSNVQYRAEKEYKNSREKFFLLLREIISNSIHAVLIRQNKETNFIPQLDLNITFDENQCKIELSMLSAWYRYLLFLASLLQTHQN